MLVQPYLNFNGRCDEAIKFYRDAIGAETEMVMRFKDCPDKQMITPGTEEKVMHASLRIGQSVVMMSDGRCTSQGSGFHGFSLSLTLKNEAEADRAFAALSAGGQVTMPLAKTFFSPKFGMVTDRFGVCWMVLIGH